MSGRNRRLTQKEIDFLIKNCNLSLEELSKKLNKSKQAIYVKLRKLGLYKSKQRRFTNEEINFIKNNYGKIKCEEIAKKLNVKISKIMHKGYELGLKSNIPSRKIEQSSIEKVKNKFEIIEIIDCKKVKVICPFCKKYFIDTLHKLAQRTKSCGCVSIGKRKGTKYISSTYFKSIIQGAKNRNIEFSISIEYAEKILIQQNFKCILSGWDLVCGYVDLGDLTSSIDRIDSNKGYIEGNIQWVHKLINMSKQKLSNKDFIEMSKAVVKNYENNH